MSKESEQVCHCSKCGSPIQNPRCENQALRYFDGEEKNGTDRS